MNSRWKGILAGVGLFLIFTLLIHLVLVLDTDRFRDSSIRTWYSSFKDKSYDGLRVSVDRKTMLVMGSSEFGHGREGFYHPSRMFAEGQMDYLTVGSPFTQSLFHTVALGALEGDLGNRKAVLLLSPTWFYKGGVKKKAYALRFSETEYLAFLEDARLPWDLKTYVMGRTERLLNKDPKLSRRVAFIDRAVRARHAGKEGLVTAVSYQLLKLQAGDRDLIRFRTAYWLEKRNLMPGLKNLSGHPNPPDASPELLRGLKGGEVIDWSGCYRRARTSSARHSHNPFYMSDSVWKKKFRKTYKKMANSHAKDSLAHSMEYKDLEAFLRCAQAARVRVCLVIQPLNGYWFDYTGLTPDKRAAVDVRVKALGRKYGARVVSLSKYDYSPFVTMDPVHPWGEGWLRINEAIYNFYQTA